MTKKSISKKTTALLIALLVTVALALWVFWPQDDLSHLKRTVDVTEGVDAVIKTVRSVVSAAKSDNPRKALMPFMYIRDMTELERVTVPLLEKPELGELKFLGCTKLAVSHSDNITVHAFSSARNRSYAFYFIKDKQGVYKLSYLGFSDRRP